MMVSLYYSPENDKFYILYQTLSKLKYFMVEIESRILKVKVPFAKIMISNGLFKSCGLRISKGLRDYIWIEYLL